MFQIKRIYAPPDAADGFRVLVDGLWPRGLSKSAAATDAWLRDVAPSQELRRWFAHELERWPEFVARYRLELASPEKAAALTCLRQWERQYSTVTLLFAARDEAHNQAVVLCDLLTMRSRQ